LPWVASALLYKCSIPVALEYAARIVDHEDGLQQVIPVYTPGFVATYRLRRDRDWLTAAEAEELRQLLADYLPRSRTRCRGRSVTH